MTKGKTTPMSDVDVGIFTDKELDLLELGRIIAGLENIVTRKVDCVILNVLYKTNPRFAFEIQAHAIPLFIKDNDAYIDYKRKVLLYYLDIKPMLDRMDAALKRRIQQGKFGERNYA